VSRTQEDSNQTKNTVLDVVKKNDGTFDLFLNRELDHKNIPEAWLPEQLCVRSDSAVRSTTRFCAKSIKTAGQRLFSDI
jgi:hypothetical protein